MNLFNRTATVAIASSTGSTVIINDLRIKFSIEKSTQSTSKAANSATVNIYNLSEQTRNQISDADDKIFVDAGYVDANNSKRIFTGAIQNITHEKSFPEIITTIKAADGQSQLRDGYTSRSFKENTSIKEIISSVIRDFGVSIARVNLGDVTDTRFSGGFQALGATRNILDNLAEVGNFEWSIQNEVLKIQKKDGGDDTTVVSLTKNSGLVGVPKRITFNENASGTDDQNRGWELTALLQPGIEPGNLVQVLSDEIQNASTFKVIDIKHEGDTHGSSWTSIMRTKVL